MLNCILIDDEPDCLELLALMLHKYCPGVQVIGQYNNPKAAIDAIWDHQPDLVFLDVDMPEVNGFGVLDACREVPFQVVFTTAYQEYAVKAFKYSAIAYLLKPIDRADLVESVSKAEHMKSLQHLAEQREVLFEYLNAARPIKEKIGLPTTNGIAFLTVSDIEYCEADGNYTKVYLFGSDKPPKVFVKILGELEELLPKDLFFRVHNSYIVNLKYVGQYIRGDGGELYMQGGAKVPVARPRKKELLERLERM